MNIGAAFVKARARRDGDRAGVRPGAVVGQASIDAEASLQNRRALVIEGNVAGGQQGAEQVFIGMMPARLEEAVLEKRQFGHRHKKTPRRRLVGLLGQKTTEPLGDIPGHPPKGPQDPALGLPGLLLDEAVDLLRLDPGRHRQGGQRPRRRPGETKIPGVQLFLNELSDAQMVGQEPGAAGEGDDLF